MDKNHIPLPKLADQYFITCHTEGKTPSTVRGYRKKLGRLVRWVEAATLSDLSVEVTKEYISYLKSAPKYDSQDDSFLKLSQGYGFSGSPPRTRRRAQTPEGTVMHLAGPQRAVGALEEDL